MYAPIYPREPTSSTAPAAAAPTDPYAKYNDHSSEFLPVLIVGILILLAVIGVFGYRAWKGWSIIGDAKSNKQKEDEWYNGSEEDAYVKRPQRAACTGRDEEENVGWQPQIRSWKGIAVQGSNLQSRTSPPPSYPFAVGISSMSEKVSPGTGVATATATNTPFKGDLPCPRIMLVQTAYLPTRDDEIPVMRGEAVRLLECQQGGWGIVQRIGALNEKGLVPISCLQERKETLPINYTGRRI